MFSLERKAGRAQSHQGVQPHEIYGITRCPDGFGPPKIHLLRKARKAALILIEEEVEEPK